jgi:hypothetical protein
MLPPGYLESLPDNVVELIREMEDAILSKMAIRITKYGWTDQSQWEKDRLEAVGVVRSDIVRILSQYTGQTEQAIQDAMADAGRTTVAQDRRYYEAAGMWREEAINREAMNKVINAGIRRTQGTFLNLTGTLAKETAKEFTKAMDRAWLEVSTGTIDAPTAGRRAIKELCAKGIQAVSYPSGHTDHVEVAVRRALVTGVNQGAMAVQDELMGELDCDLVETTAHAGARPEHALWQGKVFSRFGRTPGYATLAAGTGFGTGAGLGGWNCRHSYHPFFPGYESAYSDDILKEYQRKTCTYNGKALTDYEASQQQRYFERGIRRWKREYTAMDAAGLDTTQASVKLKQWREREADFLKQTGRRQDSSRSQIGTFGRSEAGKATWQAKTAERNRAFILNDAAAKAASSLPKKRTISDVEIQHTLDVNIGKLQGVVPSGTTGTDAYVMAGNGTSTPIRDLRRLYEAYPEYGDASGWEKVSATVYGKHHHYVVHWYQNNGKVPAEEIKLKGAK